jgi:hypothetical protein
MSLHAYSHISRRWTTAKTKTRQAAMKTWHISGEREHLVNRINRQGGLLIWPAVIYICSVTCKNFRAHDDSRHTSDFREHYDNMQVLSTLSVLAGLMSLGSCQSITKVNDFTASPTNLGMYVYVPANLKTPAPIIVAVHHCQGSAQQYSGESGLMPLASQRGFIVIFPNSKSGGGCFDVASTACMFIPRARDLRTHISQVPFPRHPHDKFIEFA